MAFVMSLNCFVENASESDVWPAVTAYLLPTDARWFTWHLRRTHSFAFFIFQNVFCFEKIASIATRCSQHPWICRFQFAGHGLTSNHVIEVAPVFFFFFFKTTCCSSLLFSAPPLLWSKTEQHGLSHFEMWLNETLYQWARYSQNLYQRTFYTFYSAHLHQAIYAKPI